MKPFTWTKKVILSLLIVFSGYLTVAQQDILVKGGTTEITSGDNSPNSTKKTDFGTLGITTQTITREFWIENSGSSDLEITGDITCSDDQFKIIQPNYTTIPQGGRVAFKIIYNPLSAGIHNGTISIPTNDSDENPFTFDVTGEGNLLFDNDNDGVPDHIDLDDDNDGILDVNECTLSFVDFSTLGASSLKSGDPSLISTTNINGGALVTDVTISAPYNVVTSGSVTPTVNIAAIPGEVNFNQNGDPMSFDVDFTFEKINTPILSGGEISDTRFNKNERLIIIPKGNVSHDFEWIKNSSSNATVTMIGNSVIIEGTTAAPVEPWAEYNITSNHPIEGFTVTFESDFTSGNNNTDIEISFCSDYDGDGIVDYLDTDSDNDGCPDAIEGGSSFVWEDLTYDTISGGVELNGVPTAASGGQTAGSSIDAATNSCPILNTSNRDTVWVCSGDSVSFGSKSFLNGGEWNGTRPHSSLNNDSIKASGVDSWYVYSALDSVLREKNLIKNHNFENGDIDFNSEYTTDCSPPIQWGGYCIDEDPNSFGDYFAGCGDVTSGSGKMYITDAATAPGVKVWCQNVLVEQNKKYEFSAWITSIHLQNPPKLQFWVNGTTLGDETQVELTRCKWQKISGEWNSNEETSAEICLLNQNVLQLGNDFALDEIYFGPIIKTPVSVKDSIYVKTHIFPNVELQENETFCEGDDPVTLDAGLHDSIVWNVGTEEQKITVDSTFLYKVVVYNEFKCSDSDSVQLTVDTLPMVTVKDTTICPGDTIQFNAVSKTAKLYQWSKKGTGQQQKSDGYEIGDYKVLVTDENSCKDSTEAKLTFHTPPLVTVNNDTICTGGDSAVFTATSTTAQQYTWSERGTGSSFQTKGIDSGRYTVIVADLNTCKDTATGILHVDTLPRVVVKDTVICSNVNSINLTAESSTAIQYLWGDLGTGTTPTISVSDPGKYSVVVTDENDCQQKDSAVLKEVQQPDPFQIQGDSIACEGDEIDLLADVNTQLISWNTTEKSKSITVTTTNDYKVIAANEAFGITCADSASFTTTFLPYPQEPNIQDFMNCFEFTNPFMIDIPTVADVVWEGFESRQDSTLPITQKGTYNASLSIYPMCSIDVSVDVIEFCPMSFYVPNAFTPNNDGFNETFEPKMYNIVSYKILIYNRWGERIFTSTNPAIQWDGTVNNRKAQQDVYVYKIIYSGYAEYESIETKQLVGTVSLIR